MKAALDGIIERYRASSGTVISLLQETQEAFGHVPEEAVRYLSHRLGIAPSRFFGVSTFYAQFRLKPPGKHRITACCGTACHVRGVDRILGSLERELKLEDGEDTTKDGKFTLERVACLGFCSFAPVVLVDGQVHGKTSPDPLVKEIRALRKK